MRKANTRSLDLLEVRGAILKQITFWKLYVSRPNFQNLCYQVARPAAFQSGIIPCSPPLDGVCGASINTWSRAPARRRAAADGQLAIVIRQHVSPRRSFAHPVQSLNQLSPQSSPHLSRRFSLIFVLARISFTGIAVRAAVLSATRGAICLRRARTDRSLHSVTTQSIRNNSYTTVHVK